MKKILTKTLPIFLGLLLLAGCATKTPDYTSSLNTNNLKGMQITIGKDGTEIKSSVNKYTGEMVFYTREEGVSFDEEDCIHTVPKDKDNVIVKHFNNGNTALLFESGTVAYGKIIITKLEDK
jgi:hypothetical protein